MEDEKKQVHVNKVFVWGVYKFDPKDILCVCIKYIHRWDKMLHKYVKFDGIRCANDIESLVYQRKVVIV